MASKTIEAAGGIVVRKGAGGLIAVVQRSKDDAWVLPRGKLKRDENPAAAARREVVEETGHRVEVHEYLGAITYRAGGRPKVVQFWHMEAEPEASHELMPDIVAVEWLPLKAAVRRLSYPLEKLFLRHAAARALKKRRAEAKAQKAKAQKTRTGKAKAENTKTDKSKTRKAKPSKAKPARKKSGKKKSKPAKVRVTKPAKAARTPSKPSKKAALKASKSAAKAHRKLRQKAKADRKKNKAKDNKNKMPAADAKPASAVRSLPDGEPKAVTKTGVVATLPPRPAAQTRSGERRTILQRVLGRLAG